MKRWVEIAIALAVAGCAGTPEKQSFEPVKPIVEKQADNQRIEKEQETSIDTNVLYLLMTAEIAGQRNQYEVALDGYLQAARQVNDPRVAERAAKIGLFIKDTQRAEEAVHLWLKEEPNNLTARKIAVLAALKTGNKAEAVKQLNAVMELDPAGVEVTLMEMSKMMEKNGKDKFLSAVLNDLAVQHPEEATIFFVQSLLASKLQEYDQAWAKIGVALRLQPDWNKALIFQAQLAGRSGNLDVAEGNLKKVLQQTPGNRRIRKMLAQVYMEKKEYTKAIDLYKQVLQNKPEDGESRFAIALIYLQQNKTDLAEKTLKLLQHDPVWRGQADFYLGRIEFKKENYDQALKWFDLVTHGPYVFDASVSAVSVLLKQRRFEDARARTNELQQKYPRQRLKIWLIQAELYNSTREYQKAFDVLSKALEDYPDNRNLLYTRALAAEQVDKLDVLETDLKKILAKKPDDAAALNALGYTLVDRTRRYAEAEKYLVRALQLRPDETVIIDSYGWLQYKLGNMKQALEYLRRAYEEQPESEITTHLAEVLWVTGKKKEARRIIEKALKVTPEDQYLLDFQRRFLQVEE